MKGLDPPALAGRILNAVRRDVPLRRVTIEMLISRLWEMVEQASELTPAYVGACKVLSELIPRPPPTYPQWVTDTSDEPPLEMRRPELPASTAPPLPEPVSPEEEPEGTLAVLEPDD